MSLKHNVFARRVTRPFTPENAIKQRMWQIRGGTLDKMLIVLPEKRVIYTVVPKAANSTIKYCLWETCGAQLDTSNMHSVEHLVSGPARRVSDTKNSELEAMIKSDDWYKFSFVRNPYGRLLSAYKDKILGMGYRKKTTSFLKKINWNKNQPPSFDEFVRAICGQDDDAMDWHWMPQTRLLMKEFINYDFIGRVELFNEDMGKVLSSLGVHTSEMKQILSSSMNTTSGKKNPVIISPETADIIRERYNDDFRCFGYNSKSFDNIH